MKPTLLVLAAGMGSRYGGLKQMDGLGPNGETIIDYSIYDAVEAGFGKVVYIVRESFKEQMEEKVFYLQILHCLIPMVLLQMSVALHL